jgi:hypothetical protein
LIGLDEFDHSFSNQVNLNQCTAEDNIAESNQSIEYGLEEQETSNEGEPNKDKKE